MIRAPVATYLGCIVAAIVLLAYVAACFRLSRRILWRHCLTACTTGLAAAPIIQFAPLVFRPPEERPVMVNVDDIRAWLFIAFVGFIAAFGLGIAAIVRSLRKSALAEATGETTLPATDDV